MNDAAIETAAGAPLAFGETATRAPNDPSSTVEAKHASSVAYLTGLLNKQLLVATKDERMFLGNLKCTDRDRNMILQSTYEYRAPSTAVIAATRAQAKTGAGAEKVNVDMTSRFLGLVTIPGEQIVKISLQEFVSQKKG